ncbi:unnamed protein product, partial [Effrenium voratum]
MRRPPPSITIDSPKGDSCTSTRRLSASRRLSTTIQIADIGTPVDIRSLQKARELLEQIRHELGGDSPAFSPSTRRAGEMAISFKEASALGAAQLFELQRLLGEGSRGAGSERLAEILANLHFFKRLTQEQTIALVSKAQLVEVEAGGIIYRDGDLLGHLYVVLCGSVAIDRAVEKAGYRRCFVSSYFDGRSFGDGWDRAGLPVRCTTAVAQEKSLLLRLESGHYREVMREGEAYTDQTAKLRSVPFLKDCSSHELEALLPMLESCSYHHGFIILEMGQKPNVCHILWDGRCQLLSGGLEVKELLPGAFFGLSSLITPCEAELQVAVSSMSADFYLLKRKSLAPLPDLVQEHILESAQSLLQAKQDPIQNDGKEVVRRDMIWRKRKQKSLAEVNRTSSGAAKRAQQMRVSASGGLWRPPGVRPTLQRPASAVCLRGATAG